MPREQPGPALRVAFLTPYGYRTASTRQRVYKNVALFPPEHLVAVLAVEGLSLAPPRHRRVVGPLAEIGRGLLAIWRARRYDVVVVQKGLSAYNLRGLPWLLRRLCPRTLFDFDDAVHLRSPRSFRWRALRWLCDERQALLLMRDARVVTAGNPHLAQVARRVGRSVRVVPTAVDTELYPLRPPSRGPGCVVGWSGSSGTNHYLQRLAPVLSRLAARHPGLRLSCVSADTRDLDLGAFAPCPTGFRVFRLERLVADLHGFDIGVMPLDDDEWSRSKCGGKLLQYMACGIPPVCSPVGVNSELVEDGVSGFLARDEREWLDRLERLILEPELRARMGAAARARVEQRWSNRAVAPLLLEAILEAAGASGERRLD